MTNYPEGSKAGLKSVYIRKATFGHGSYGYECVLCSGTNYKGGRIEHHPACPQYTNFEDLINDRRPEHHHICPQHYPCKTCGRPCPHNCVNGVIPDPDRGSGSGPYWDSPCPIHGEINE